MEHPPRYFVMGLVLLSAIVPLAIICRGYLPGAQMKLLDELLTETKGIYQRAQAAGSLPASVQAQIQAQLMSYGESMCVVYGHHHANELQVRTCCLSPPPAHVHVHHGQRRISGSVARALAKYYAGFNGSSKFAIYFGGMLNYFGG